MDYFSLTFGILVIAYGIYTLIVRAKNPQRLTKLTAMKEKMGSRRGTIIHTISYSVIPILLGLILITLEIIKLKNN